MFYNGATRDARWRIGWVAFDRGCRRVIERCSEPLIVAPPLPEAPGIDIAFAASCLVAGKGLCHLYYSVEDRALRRATVRRV